jgi:diguanylate cyclase (GGDEF)-like protein
MTGHDTLDARPPLQALLASAQAARDTGAQGDELARALAEAEAAWDAAAGAAPALRRQAGVLRAYFRYRSGALSASVDAGLEALPLLRAGGEPAARVELLRQVALCAIDTHRFDVALPCAQEACREAHALGDATLVSLTTNALGCFFERTGDPWQAERLLREAIELARPVAHWRPLFAGLNNLAAVLIGTFHLLRDTVPLAQARAPLLRARPVLEEAVTIALTLPDPFGRVFAGGNLGEALVHLGALDEAAPLLDDAMARARIGGFDAQVPRIACSQGELALLRGHPELALHILLHALQEAPAADQPATRLRLHHAVWRTARVLGRTELALQHLEPYMQLERERAVVQLRAQSDLFVTRVEVEQARQQASRESARAAQFEAYSHFDALTGLANRRELARRWPELLRHAEAAGLPLAVAMVDADHFKPINDTHGHAVGDRVLVTLAQLMRATTRTGDLVARTGGEEFLLVLPDTAPERAQEVCERLRRRVAEHDWTALAPGLAVTLSIGLAGSPPLDAAVLVQRADAALYRAKQAGRNRVEGA